MKRNNALNRIACASLLVLGLSWTGAQAASYTFVELHAGGSEITNTTAHGIDGLGLQAGYSGMGDVVNGINGGLRWSGTAASMQGLTTPLIHSPALDVSQGQIVGIGANVGSPAHALLWPSPTASPIDLHPAGYAQSYGWGIHAGKQVGWAVTETGGTHAMLWSGTAASAVSLHPAGYDLSYARGIHGNQQVGHTSTPSYQYRAVLWTGSAASMVSLHPTGFTTSCALGTDGSYQVGYGLSSGGAYHALMWAGTASSVVDLNPTALGISQSYAYSTANGVQVGYGSGTSTGGNDHALVWNGNAASAQDLHAFVPSGWAHSQAYDIDDQGNIVGVIKSSDGVCHAALWVPIATQRWVPYDYSTIQAAVYASGSGDQIMVMPGTYNENVTVNNKALTISGVNPDDPEVTYYTVIYGTGSQAAVSLLGAGTKTLRGVTITNGTDGVRVGNGDALVSKCLIQANSDYGIHSENGSGTTTSSFNWVINNGKRGIYSGANTTLVVEAGLVGGNQGGIQMGSSSSTSTIRDCMILGNTTSGNGGGIYSEDRSLLVSNCTMATNQAGIGGAMYLRSASRASTVNVTQSILWANTATYGSAFALDGTAGAPPNTFTATYSDMQTGFYVSQGNWTWSVAGTCFPDDPLFVNPAGPDGNPATWADNDYHIQRLSRCVSGGSPTFVPVFGETDSDGQQRVIGVRVDVGADEFKFPGDANSDGAVDVVDLLTVVYSFGISVGEPGFDPTADFNVDGTVDVVDLLILLDDWGDVV